MLITIEKGLDRFRRVPPGQRKFLFCILCMWTFSTIGFISGAETVANMTEGPPRILNMEASFREFLHKSNDGMLRVLDMMYTSPIENWWKATRQWSKSIIIVLHERGIETDTAITAFKNWFNMNAHERLGVMSISKLTIESIMEYLPSVTPNKSIMELPLDAYQLVETAKKLAPQNYWVQPREGVPLYDGRQIDSWISRKRALEWVDYDPMNRLKERMTYLKIGAVRDKYREYNLTSLARKIDDDHFKMATLEPGLDRTYDWDLTDEMLEALPDGELKKWFNNSPEREMDKSTLENALEAANLFIQVHDSNKIGWMNSHSLSRIKLGDAVYSASSEHGPKGSICLQFSKVFCMG